MNLYEDLGVPPDATADQIKKAFREASKEHHPDKGGDAKEFHAIARAYAVLGNEEKRGRYDKGETEEAIQGAAATEDQMAAEVLVSIYLQVVESGNVRQRDVVGIIRSTLRDNIGTVDKQIATEAKVKERFEEALKRVKCKGEQNIFARATEQRIRDLEGGIAAKEKMKRIAEVAIRTLEAYVYEFEKQDLATFRIGDMSSAFQDRMRDEMRNSPWR